MNAAEKSLTQIRELGRECPEREAWLVAEMCDDYRSARKDGSKEPWDGADREVRQWAQWARGINASAAGDADE